MSKELATKNLIHDKISSFPGANGADVLLTRKEIEETSLAVVTGSCLQNEIPIMDNVIGAESWEYVFSIDRTSANVANTGESVRVNITSYKKKYIGGIDTGETQPVDVTVAYHSGYDFDRIDRSGLPNYVDINCPENTNEYDRSETDIFTQAESGKTALFTVNQAAATVTWQYTFDRSASSKSIGATGGSFQIDVTSYKTKYINGKSTGETQQVGYSVQQDIVNFSSVDTSGYPSYVTFNVNENTNTSSRTDYWYFVQEENINRISFIIRQDAGSVTYDYTIYFSPGSTSWNGDEFDRRYTTITAEKRTIVNGKVTSQTPVSYTHTYSGDTGDFNYSKNGDTFSVVPQGTNDSGVDYVMEISAYINEASSYRDTFTALQYTT